MTVKVYSTDWCPYCHALMNWLDSLDVAYQEINAEDLIKKSEIKSVPVTEIGRQKIIGFDRPAIKKALLATGVIKK